jgi:arsenate reductase
MTAQIFGIKTCDTCRKAAKALPDAAFVDVRTDGISDEMLTAALDQFEGKVVNTRSTTWRGLDESQRRGAPLALLKAHPTLMKRPLIAVDNTLFLGWNSDIEAKVKALL